MPAFDLFPVHTPQQYSDCIAGLGGAEHLVEHFEAGCDGLADVAGADDFDFLADVQHAAFDPAGYDGVATLDPEYVLDRHEEGPVRYSGGLRGCTRPSR